MHVGMHKRPWQVTEDADGSMQLAVQLHDLRQVRLKGVHSWHMPVNGAFSLIIVGMALNIRSWSIYRRHLVLGRSMPGLAPHSGYSLGPFYHLAGSITLIVEFLRSSIRAGLILNNKTRERIHSIYTERTDSVDVIHQVRCLR